MDNNKKSAGLVKEMVYSNTKHREILVSDTYKGFTYYVISYGTHPCGYVEIPKEHLYYGKHMFDDDVANIEVHGGITFSDNTSHWAKFEGKPDGWLIGWDYAHYGDYVFHSSNYGIESFGEKKWSTTEIIADCKAVIDQICDVEKMEVNE